MGQMCRPNERIDRVAARDRAPREDEEHRQIPDAAGEIRGELERRRIGDVHVVEQQRERSCRGRVFDELDGRLEQPGAGEIGRHFGGVAEACGRACAAATAPGARAPPARSRRRAAGSNCGESPANSSAHGPNGGAPPPRSSTVARPTRAGRATASASSASRVFPIPASPVISAIAPPPASTSRHSVISAVTSRSRPTNGGSVPRTAARVELRRTSMPRGPAPSRIAARPSTAGAPASRPSIPPTSASRRSLAPSARIVAASARVSADVASPKVVRRRSASRSNVASAATRSPAAVWQRIRSRAATSSSGSSASLRRA